MARRRGDVCVTTSYIDPITDDETDISVECAITPGEEPGPSGPGCGPEVEIVSALSADGRDWREAIESDARWFDRVCDDAFEEAADADEAAREDAEERERIDAKYTAERMRDEQN